MTCQISEKVLYYNPNVLPRERDGLVQAEPCLEKRQRHGKGKENNYERNHQRHDNRRDPDEES